ncbi:MAG: RecX family transcriptional regulator, partial [Candidatus Eremiobacteraeota bacterium]|nr:RecX family transcriptional regulator [Candidatus Eremiobacteraeota bacterium]
TAVARCKAERYLDDALFAALYVERARDAKGDRRLVGELVRRGLDAQCAQQAVADAPLCERDRCLEALAKLRRAQPRASYPSLARSLERKGFPASLIYAILREAALRDGALEGIEAALRS